MPKNKVIDIAKNYINMLLSPLEHLYYHQYDHALDVMQRSIELGKKEGVNKEELEILAIASLFHDTGFVIQYDNNEYIGAKIARNYLKGVLYPEKKIKIVEQLILSTDPNYKKPKNILEKIIKDADIDNLGREDFFEKLHNISDELASIKNIKTKDPNWIHGTIKFLESLKFETETQKKERGEQKEKNLNILKNMLKELDEKEII